MTTTVYGIISVVVMVSHSTSPEKTRVLAPRLTAQLSPRYSRSGNKTSLQERAGGLVANQRSLKEPSSIGRFSLQVVGFLAGVYGLPWLTPSKMEELLPKLEALRKQVENPDLVLPDAYLKGFHGFPEGANTIWLHALNMESAMAVFSKIALGKLAKSGREAREMQLQFILNHLQEYLRDATPKAIVDIGAGSGASTRFFARAFPDAKVVGVDASEYMLAEAMRNPAPEDVRIDWVTQLGQDTRLPNASADMVTVCFMAHEQRADIMRSVCEDVLRVLQPGGVLAIADYDKGPLLKQFARWPRSVAMFVSMLAFEPWVYDYLNTDFIEMLDNVGYEDVFQQTISPGAQLLLARKPTTQKLIVNY